MSTIRRDETKVIIDIADIVVDGQVWRVPFEFDCSTKWNACLAIEVLGRVLHQRLQRIRFEAYLMGIDDARAHRKNKDHPLMSSKEEFSSDF
jgi:hypothetical protein